MANEIYRTTHAGLAGLVSPRAATRLLDQALARAGLDPDRLGAGEAQRLLRGRLRRDLEAILPSSGLRRELARVDRRVMRLAPQEAPHEAAAAVTPPPSAAPAEAGGASAPAAPAARPSARPFPRTGDLVRAVAERDAVRGVVHLRNGHLHDARGRDVDASRAAALTADVTTRLSRHGALRSWHVHTSAGHVLAGEGRDHTLLVHGRERLNLGAIYALIEALEEES